MPSPQRNTKRNSMDAALLVVVVPESVPAPSLDDDDDDDFGIDTSSITVKESATTTHRHTYTLRPRKKPKKEEPTTVAVESLQPAVSSSSSIQRSPRTSGTTKQTKTNVIQRRRVASSVDATTSQTGSSSSSSSSGTTVRHFVGETSIQTLRGSSSSSSSSTRSTPTTPPPRQPLVVVATRDSDNNKKLEYNRTMMIRMLLNPTSNIHHHKDDDDDDDSSPLLLPTTTTIPHVTTTRTRSTVAAAVAAKANENTAPFVTKDIRRITKSLLSQNHHHPSRTLTMQTRSKTLKLSPSPNVKLPVVTPHQHRATTTTITTSASSRALTFRSNAAATPSTTSRTKQLYVDRPFQLGTDSRRNMNKRIIHPMAAAGVVNIFCRGDAHHHTTMTTTFSPQCDHRGQLSYNDYITVYGSHQLFLLHQQQQVQWENDEAQRTTVQILENIKYDELQHTPYKIMDKHNMTTQRNRPREEDEYKLSRQYSTSSPSSQQSDMYGLTKDDDDTESRHDYSCCRPETDCHSNCSMDDKHTKGDDDNDDDDEMENESDTSSCDTQWTPQYRFRSLSPITMDDALRRKPPVATTTKPSLNDHQRDCGIAAASSTTTVNPVVTIRNQPLVTINMRRTLVQWISEVCQEFSLSDATYHLSVTLVDQTLLFYPKNLPRQDLQGVACACLWVASKMEDVTPPSRDALCYISDYSVSSDDLLKLERQICRLFEFRLQRVTPFHFIHIYLRASFADSAGATPHNHRAQLYVPIDAPMVSLSLYLLELSRTSSRLTEEPPNLLAASCIYLARATLGVSDKTIHMEPGHGCWTKTLEHFTGYDTTDMSDTIRAIYMLQIAAESAWSSGLVGGCPAYERYSTSAHFFVSFKVPPRLEDLGLPRNSNYDPLNYEQMVRQCIDANNYAIRLPGKYV